MAIACRMAVSGRTGRNGGASATSRKPEGKRAHKGWHVLRTVNLRGEAATLDADAHVHDGHALLAEQQERLSAETVD